MFLDKSLKRKKEWKKCILFDIDRYACKFAVKNKAKQNKTKQKTTKQSRNTIGTISLQTANLVKEEQNSKWNIWLSKQLSVTFWTQSPLLE